MVENGRRYGEVGISLGPWLETFSAFPNQACMDKRFAAWVPEEGQRMAVGSVTVGQTVH